LGANKAAITHNGDIDLHRKAVAIPAQNGGKPMTGPWGGDILEIVRRFCIAVILTLISFVGVFGNSDVKTAGVSPRKNEESDKQIRQGLIGNSLEEIINALGTPDLADKDVNGYSNILAWGTGKSTSFRTSGHVRVFFINKKSVLFDMEFPGLDNDVETYPLVLDETPMKVYQQIAIGKYNKQTKPTFVVSNSPYVAEFLELLGLTSDSISWILRIYKPFIKYFDSTSGQMSYRNSYPREFRLVRYTYGTKEAIKKFLSDQGLSEQFCDYQN
jgi:hypothetical protein